MILQKWYSPDAIAPGGSSLSSFLHFDFFGYGFHHAINQMPALPVETKHSTLGLVFAPHACRLLAPYRDHGDIIELDFFLAVPVDRGFDGIQLFLQ